MSSIWVLTKSYLWGNNGEQPEVTSPEVIWQEEALPGSGSLSCACATGSFTIFSPEVTGRGHDRKWWCAHAQPVHFVLLLEYHGYLWPKVTRRGWRVCACPIGSCAVGPFHRKLATGSDIIFPRIFLISSTKCWLGCSLRRPHLPLSLVIFPYYIIITYKVCCFRICCVVLQGWYF